MCTVVLGIEPGGFRLLGVRDEFLGRPWRPPASHWPGRPVVGGLDKQAGGTWLAVHPAERRVACVLNGRGAQPPPSLRKSRGDLPLRAAIEGEISHLELAHYDAFHLVCVDVASAWMLSWDGRQAVSADLPHGTHVLTNAGHVYPGGQPDEKGEYFGPRFAARGTRAEWMSLSSGDGLAPDDPRAIIVRRELPDGRVWGTSSLSLAEVANDRLSYDFRAVEEEWRRVPVDAISRSTAR